MISGIWNNYKEYLESPEWKEKSKSFLLFHPICKICGEKSTCVHHKSYERVGQEKQMDLMPLCHYCHYNIHFGEKEKEVFENENQRKI